MAILASGDAGRGGQTISLLILLGLMVTCSARCRSQARGADDPQLHRRSESIGDQDTVVVAKRSRSSLVPEDASGEYALGDSGSVIEISVQSGALDGYISKLGDLESDRGTPLTYFFARSDLRQRQVSFVTRRVHGVWYSFEGSIVRGPARSHREPGFYLLDGELVEHNTVLNTQQGSSVSLKLARREGENE